MVKYEHVPLDVSKDIYFTRANIFGLGLKFFKLLTGYENINYHNLSANVYSKIL